MRNDKFVAVAAHARAGAVLAVVGALWFGWGASGAERGSALAVAPSGAGRALVLPVLLDEAQRASDGDVQTFARAVDVAAWSFSEGPEWPGAAGKLLYRAEAGRTGDGALALQFDFEQGGNYVAAITELPSAPPVRAVRLWVQKPGKHPLTFRAVDADGETFQKTLRFDYRGWQQLEVALAGWNHHWGGDGEFAWPARQFHVLLENQGVEKRGELLIDDVQWLATYDAADDAVRTSTYTETGFAAEDGWTCRERDGEYAPGRWKYRWGADGQSRLVHGKSLLARPQALKVQVESDGRGHELRAVCGSHFQNFERVLGTLDAPGPQTFEVPLGDMKSWRHFGGEDDGVVRYPLRLEALVLKKKGDGEAGDLGLKQVDVTTEYDRDRPVYVIPSVTNAGGWLPFVVDVRNLLDEPLAGKLRVQIDHRPPQDSLLKVPARGRATWTSTLNLGGNPWSEGHFEYYTEGLTSGPQMTSVTRIWDPPADKALDAESRIGAGLYLYRLNGQADARGLMDRVCRLAAGAGVKWTREEFQWHRIEPRKGEFDFAFHDQLVEAAHAQGISVYGLCCYYTDWQRPPVSDEFIENYCAYLRAVVGRYKDRIKHWEIWNEPNIFFWPDRKERYPVLLKAAYETIKAVDPDAQVLGCSTAGIDTAFIKMVLEAGAPFDAVTVHPYRAELDALGFGRELREVRELTGGRDVWITEMGWSSEIGGLSERGQAAAVGRTYIAALASGAARNVAWYDFREDGDDPFYNEHNFGLVRQDFGPKAGYAALAAVGQLLGATQFVEPVELGPELLAFRFAPRAGKDGRHVVAVWSTDRTRLVRLRGVPENAEVRHGMNGPGQNLRLGGELVLCLEREMPMYLVTQERLEVVLGAPLVEFDPAAATIHPGEAVRVTWAGDPEIRVRPPRIPPGWTAERPQATSVMVKPPTWLRTANVEITFGVEVGPVPAEGPDRMPAVAPVFEVPVRVEVVPEVLRG